MTWVLFFFRGSFCLGRVLSVVLGFRSGDGEVSVLVVWRGVLAVWIVRGFIFAFFFWVKVSFVFVFG